MKRNASNKKNKKKESKAKILNSEPLKVALRPSGVLLVLLESILFFPKNIIMMLICILTQSLDLKRPRSKFWFWT